MDNPGEIVLATGAVGTAAFGIVESLKFTRIGLFGFARLKRSLTPGVLQALERAYGRDWEAVIQGHYRQDRATGALARALRQGVRVGLDSQTAGELAKSIGIVEGGDLASALSTVKAAVGDDDTAHPELTEARGRIARFELAIDARIEAAIAVAEATYAGQIRLVAAFIAIALSLVGGYTLSDFAKTWPLALVVGIAAVPIAPIARDVAGALNSVRRALGATK